MFEAENIREWVGQDVVDASGDKVGEMTDIYVDTSTDQPAWVTVQIGMIGRHRLTFVPLDRATVGPGYVKVAYDKKMIKDAPTIETEGELPAEDEPGLFEHYGLTYVPGTRGERLLARR